YPGGGGVIPARWIPAFAGMTGGRPIPAVSVGRPRSVSHARLQRGRRVGRAGIGLTEGGPGEFTLGQRSRLRQRLQPDGENLAVLDALLALVIDPRPEQIPLRTAQRWIETKIRTANRLGVAGVCTLLDVAGTRGLAQDVTVRPQSRNVLALLPVDVIEQERTA